MKALGAVLVLLGGVIVFLDFSLTQRRQLALIRDIAAALTQMAGEIRWKLLPLPEAIRHLEERKISGKYFGEIHRSLKGGNTLQNSWEHTFRSFSSEMGGILLSMEWGGDIQRQEASILYAARQLTELGERKAETLRQREKLCAAATLSTTGLLVLILM